MDGYVIVITDNGGYRAEEAANPTGRVVTGVSFTDKMSAQRVAANMNDLRTPPENASQVAMEESRKLASAPPSVGTGATSVSGTPPQTDVAAIQQAEKQIQDAENAPRIVPLPTAPAPQIDPRSPDGSPTYQAPIRQNLNDPTVPEGTIQQRKNVYAEAAFGDTAGRTQTDGSLTPVRPVDPLGANIAGIMNGQFENPQIAMDIAAGDWDSRRAVDYFLEQNGLSRHANKGQLMQGADNFGSLYGLANAGQAMPEDYEMAMGAQDFIGEMAGGGRVNTRGLYDNMFSQDFSDQVGANYGAMEGGENAPSSSTYEMEQVMGGIAALAPHIGDQNTQYLMGLTNQAYYEYMASPERQAMDFITYLRDVKNAGDWY